jgi:hypothetical protein
MDRLTRTFSDNNSYFVDETKIKHDENGYSGEAICKLAKYENVYEDLLSKQKEISMELEKLRVEGKTHTVKFKQLFANKLTNSNILVLFETYGLK